MSEEWRESFKAFLDDMGEKPHESHILRRKDPTGDYCRQNCEWSPRWAANLARDRSRPGRSRFCGVGFHTPTGRWKARITAHKRTHFLGYFDSEDAAAQAYNAKARELHGRYAQLNVVERENKSARVAE